jgi:hypothetical protein
MQIQRLKRTLMPKIWIPKLYASTIASIWTCGRPNSGKELGYVAPEMPAAQTSPKSDRLSSKSVLGSYLHFQENKWIPKLEIISCHTTWTLNFHCLESGRGRYDTHKEGLRIRKIRTMLSLWKPSSLLPQGRSRARQVGACPKDP